MIDEQSNLDYKEGKSLLLLHFDTTLGSTGDKRRHPRFLRRRLLLLLLARLPSVSEV